MYKRQELCVTYALFNVYILPFAIVPIVVRTFFDSRTALFTHLIIVLICSLMVPFPHEFLLLQIVAGMVVTFSLKELSERSQLIRCAVFIFLSYAACYLSLTLYQEANLNKINWMMMLYFGINFILLMFTYVLVYMLEKTFGYVSSITLVELSNINNPILKKLSETCPGTFQHSLQVSILASEAAAKIGANSQLVRTGALYHDIGKMSNPVSVSYTHLGEQIRVNFSRVEWTTDVKDGKYVKVPIQGEDKIREYNWVWAPTGVINIHMPEYWGYVQISDKIAGEGETPFVKHPSEETKWILRNLYYRQNEFAATFGHYADNINDLKANELCPQEIANQLEIHTTPSMYEISLPAPDGTVWNIRQDGLVWPKKK